MTYSEWYLEGLYDLLERGGTQEDVDHMVAEVNRPTPEGLAKFLALRSHPNPMHGFSGLIGPCSVCGEPFAVPNPSPTLDQEVVCLKCIPPSPS